MDQFIYKAKNLNGNLIRGSYTGADVSELVDYLHAKEYYLISYRRIYKKINLTLNSRIRIKDISIFCKQLSAILYSGIPIIEALTLLAFQSTSKNLREALSLLINDIKSGDSLFNGLKKSKYIFPDFFIYMIKIGEDSGKLDETLAELAAYYEREGRLGRKIRGAMFYPTAMFIATIVITVILMVTVVPSLTSMLTSMGGEIPAITSAVMSTSLFMKSNLLYIITGASIVIPAVIFLNRQIKSDFHQLILTRLPGFGRLYKKIIEIKFSRAMGLLLGSGINLISAMEMTAVLVNDNRTKQELTNAIKEINEGFGLSEALSMVQCFEPLMLSMLKVGEETGKLDEMFDKLASIFEDETYELIMRLTEFIQPVMIFILAGIVGFIVISVMLPMMSIMDTVQ